MTRKEQIRAAAEQALKDCPYINTSLIGFDFFVKGAMWADAHLWKDAQGDDLPDYDREVVVLVQHVPEYHDSLRVSFGHRQNPKGYVVVKGEKLYARTYDKGWSQPNVRYWLDAKLPYEKEEEEQ